MASSIEFVIAESAFCVVVKGTSVSLQKKFVGADGEVLKDSTGVPRKNLKFFLSIDQCMKLFSLEDCVVREAEELRKILDSESGKAQLATGVECIQREVSKYKYFDVNNSDK